MAAIIRDGKPHRQYQYESPAHGTVPVLGRLNASNRVNGGYYTINGVETQIDKGDLSTIGKEIDNVPPAPPTPPTPRIPPAPPAAPGPSSTPSSSQGKKGRPGKPSAPSGGGGGPAAILPPAIEPVPIVDPTGQTALDIPGMDFLNPPRQRPSAVTGLDDPNQATPPPGQMDPDFSQSVAEPDPESLPPTPRVQPTPYSHVPGIGSARASAAGGIGLALGYASKGEVAILRNSEAFPWAVRAGLVDSDGRLTPEGEVFRERDPYVSTLRGKSLVVARLAEGSDALARDIRVMHESWFALSSEGEGGGDAIALLARRISSRERIGETVAKKRAKRVLELHESLGLGVNSTRGARGRKSFAVGELDIRDAAPAVVYSVALKAEAGTGELPSRSLEADLETTLFGYNTSTTSGNDIYNWADYNLTIERQRAVAPYQVIWRQGHRFGLNSVSILDHLLSVDW